MERETPSHIYRTRLADVEAALAGARRRDGWSQAALGLGAMVVFFSFVVAAAGHGPKWLPGVAMAATALALRLFAKHHALAARGWRLRLYYERALRRLEGDWAEDAPTGDEFTPEGHPYARDLNVTGHASAFSLLCVARTAVGRRGLAKYLLELPPLEETRARQLAVAEWKPRADLRERLAAAGEFAFTEAKWESFTGWLEDEPAGFSPGLRWVAGASSLALLALLAATVARWVPLASSELWMAGLLAFQGALGWVLRPRVNRALEALRPAAVEIGLLRQCVELALAEEFTSAKLRALQEELRGAAAPLRRLERALSLASERSKDWFYLPGLALMLGTQTAIASEGWRARHGADMPRWLRALGEMEALHCLANFAFENPEYPFPEVAAGAPFLEAAGLGHPLLPAGECVTNSVRLGEGARFYVISGSNMSGKSTLLRAIGLNAALARAGAPVRAERLRMSALEPFASIAITDSLESGRSKFLVEVERLKQMMEGARAGGAALFLIDEILAGTNSSDRRVASEAVVRALLAAGAVGALSTHDLALTEIAAKPELAGVNVHTGSREGGGPLDFDYLLKPGVTTESNAIAIARLAGVDI